MNVKVYYSFWGSIIGIFIISFSWISYIFMFAIEYTSGFNEKDLIGATFMFFVYMIISLILIFGVLRFTLVKIIISTERIKIKKIGRITEIIFWSNIRTFKAGMVPTYIYGKTRGYIINYCINDTEKTLFMIKNKKLSKIITQLDNSDCIINLEK